MGTPTSPYNQSQPTSPQGHYHQPQTPMHHVTHNNNQYKYTNNNNNVIAPGTAQGNWFFWDTRYILIGIVWGRQPPVSAHVEIDVRVAFDAAQFGAGIAGRQFTQKDAAPALSRPGVSTPTTAPTSCQHGSPACCWDETVQSAKQSGTGKTPDTPLWFYRWVYFCELVSLTRGLCLTGGLSLSR